MRSQYDLKHFRIYFIVLYSYYMSQLSYLFTYLIIFNAEIAKLAIQIHESSIRSQIFIL